MPPVDIADAQAILIKTLQFSSTDVATNRQNRLSEAQRTRIQNKHHANSRLAWVAFCILFGLGLCGFSADMIRTGDMGLKPLLIYFGVTAFFGLWVWGFILFYRHQMNRTLRNGSVRPVTGRIRLLAERREKVTQRYFCVGKHRSRIDTYSHFALIRESGIEGLEATAYVSAPWRSLLSVDLLA